MERPKRLNTGKGEGRKITLRRINGATYQYDWS